MREETREHQTVDTYALLPPTTDDRLRLRGGTYDYAPVDLPQVLVVDPPEKERSKSRCSCCCRTPCWRRYVKPIVWTVLVLFVVDVVQDYLLVGYNKGIPAPPIIQRDYSQIKRIEDLTTIDSSVQSKCFHKQSTKCACKDPIQPEGRLTNQQWAQVHHWNKDAAVSKAEQGGDVDVDVVFLGDSITEGWLGNMWGRKNAKVHDVPPIFESLFSIKGEGGGGGEFEGLALGIAGDLSPNLLWRIQNGELPDTLNPPVIWLLIGTNDFGNTWCSAEMVLIGIVRVVEELRLRKPGSIVVINAILPRTYNRNGYVSRGRARKWWKKKSPPAMPSLWDDIEAVNDELRNYAASRDKVEYFETKVFFVDPSVPDENLQINSQLMPDYLHPSAEGYKLWGQEIVQKLKVLIPR